MYVFLHVSNLNYVKNTMKKYLSWECNAKVSRLITVCNISNRVTFYCFL